ncbi:Hydroxyacylglutathione hydrolase [Pseudomonas fluorescens]|jgi:glyoxylase-like metal-dependent hydrolase (beta-lactamase superfamily II)|uniref:Hydroxyacylglutathione hydrolase n=1 Tax=Pseudomonas fluorescens TaxID=294 RepID=A0A5E7W3J1_PSEFL|nr:MBL fold metallo-hydrolase [Pseudomonas fluorescens]VVQ29516.1 Hydroxyacylglutathione hydrolase [Pseudomonas fluorescens]
MRKFVKALTLFSFSILSAPFAIQAQEASTGQSPAFVVHKLTDFLYTIGEPNYYQKNYSYLLVGTDQALMFDSGANQKEDITSVARKITDKPLSMLPSHLHFDHLGGLHNFQSIYLVDMPFTRQFKGQDGFYRVPEPVYLGNFDHMVVPPFKVARLIKPDETIDLGGLKVRLINVPGHTQDEVALYDETHNILLAGDHVYPSWLLAGNLKDYVASLDATLKVINEQTAIYGAHADEDPTKVPAMTYADVQAIRDKMVLIQAGRAKGETFSDPELIKSSELYKVEKDISILTNIQFTDGRGYGY